jgi:hypothetical protein
MRKRQLRLLTAPLLAVMVILGGCGPSETPRAVTHVVVCWLKDPGNADARDQIIEASRSFSAIPGVRGVRVGPALPSERAIVDDSFDVAIVLSFEDNQALARYLEHPRHQKAVREVLQPLVRKVIVYDFLEK